jgi:hypothetical protein
MSVGFQASLKGRDGMKQAVPRVRLRLITSDRPEQFMTRVPKLIRSAVTAGSLALLGPACAHIAPPAVPDDIQRLPAVRMPLTLAGSWEEDRGARRAQRYVNEVLRVLTWPEFEQNLAQISQHVGRLWLSSFGGSLDSREVAAIYFGRVERNRAVPAALHVIRDGGAGTMQDGDNNRVKIVLGMGAVEQWLSDNAVMQSCAVNTLAHELSHTFPQSQEHFSYLFADNARKWATILNRSLASYTIGAVAQCTYLGRLGRMTGGSLPACVEYWGTNSFDGRKCFQRESTRRAD